MVEGTRLRILHLVQKAGQATVDSLAQSLGLASATVRRHLDILQRNQLINYQEVHKKTGRPEYSFFLTETGQESLPKDYHKLLGSLLKEMSSLSSDEISGKGGAELLEHLLQRISGQVVERYTDRLEDRRLSSRLSVLVDLLSDENFSPEAEDTDTGIRIKLFNCPFRHAAMENAIVCALDAHLISTILQAPVTQEMCIRDGYQCCTYLAQVGPGISSSTPS